MIYPGRTLRSASFQAQSNGKCGHVTCRADADAPLRFHSLPTKFVDIGRPCRGISFASRRINGSNQN
jgi:hypothetical protein